MLRLRAEVDFRWKNHRIVWGRILPEHLQGRKGFQVSAAGQYPLWLGGIDIPRVPS
jgi:hypothetical protein